MRKTSGSRWAAAGAVCGLLAGLVLAAGERLSIFNTSEKRVADLPEYLAMGPGQASASEIEAAAKSLCLALQPVVQQRKFAEARETVDLLKQGGQFGAELRELMLVWLVRESLNQNPLSSGLNGETDEELPDDEPSSEDSQAFDRIDADGDSELTESELTNSRMPAQFISDSREADSDKNNKLSRSEFAKFMKRIEASEEKRDAMPDETGVDTLVDRKPIDNKIAGVKPDFPLAEAIVDSIPDGIPRFNIYASIARARLSERDSAGAKAAFQKGVAALKGLESKSGNSAARGVFWVAACTLAGVVLFWTAAQLCNALGDVLAGSLSDEVARQATQSSRA